MFQLVQPPNAPSRLHSSKRAFWRREKIVYCFQRMQGGSWSDSQKIWCYVDEAFVPVCPEASIINWHYQHYKLHLSLEMPTLPKSLYLPVSDPGCGITTNSIAVSAGPTWWTFWLLGREGCLSVSLVWSPYRQKEMPAAPRGSMQHQRNKSSRTLRRNV